MNDLEKKSFYSFLALYLSSSLFFVLLSGFWYFNAQKNSLENTTYYKMQNLADTISSLIINVHMHGTELLLPEAPKGYSYVLVLKKENKVYAKNYFEENGFKVLVSSAPQEHMDVKYVVIKTNEYHISLEKLKNSVLVTMCIIFLLIVIISYVLSKLFMKPIRQKVVQIESFIQDISHELNTPITALQMSSKRAMQKGVYDEKILRNISISTKQLYSIYKSLAYLNFKMPEQEIKSINIKPILQRSIEYYTELSDAKDIYIVSEMEDANLKIIEDRVTLMFSNLISNAIKYSMPKTKITITLRDGCFSIEDEGVGIDKDKIESIFKLYSRDSNLAGGFGVGLSIVKQICDEFDIRIDVESKLGEGSKFSLKW